MKSRFQPTIVLCGALTIGAAVILATLVVVIADGPRAAWAFEPPNVVKGVSIPVGATLPAATQPKPTQVVLQAVIIDFDPEKLTKTGIVLPEQLTGDGEVVLEKKDGAKARRINTVIGKGEGKLLTSLLTSTGAGKVLASPTIVAITGRKASFRSGGQLPILTPAGKNQTSIEYRNLGTTIDFLPSIQPDGKIRLDLSIEHAAIDRAKAVDVQGVKVPGLEVGRIQTMIAIEPGRTALFGSTAGRQLLMLVTPELASNAGLPLVAASPPVIPSLPPAARGGSPNPFTDPRQTTSPGSAPSKASSPNPSSSNSAPPKASSPNPSSPNSAPPKTAPQATTKENPAGVGLPGPPHIPNPQAAGSAGSRTSAAEYPYYTTRDPREFFTDNRYARPRADLSRPRRISMSATVFSVKTKELAAREFSLKKVLTGEAKLPGVVELKEDLGFDDSITSVITSRKAAELSKLLLDGKAATVLSRPQLESRSGQRAKSEVLSRVQLPVRKPLQVASARTADLGIRMELLPTFQEGRIHLTARAEYSRLEDERIKTQTFFGAASMFSGEVLVLCQDAKQGEQLLIFVAPTTIGYSDPDPIQAGGPVTQPPAALPRPNPARTDDIRSRYGPNHPKVQQSKKRAEEIAKQQAQQQALSEEKKAIRLREAERAMHDVLPNCKIKLHPLPESVVISGTVVSQQQAEVVKDVVGNFFPDVIDNLTISHGASPEEPNAAGPQSISKVLKELFPQASIRLHELNNSIVLSGRAKPENVNKIMEIAEDYYANVINNLNDHQPHDQFRARNWSQDQRRQPSTTQPSTTQPAGPKARPPQFQSRDGSLRDELRELRGDVQGLRREVSRLIRLLESRPAQPAANSRRPGETRINEFRSDETQPQAAPSDAVRTPREGSAGNLNNREKDAAVKAQQRIQAVQELWSLIGMHAEPCETNGSRYRGGMKVTEVRANSPAAKQGVRKGDVLVGLGNWEMVEYGNVGYALRSLDSSSDRKLKFYLLRGKETLFGHFELPARPQPASQSRSEPQPSFSPLEHWPLTIDEAVKIGLQNSKVIGNRGALIEMKDGVTGVVVRGAPPQDLTQFEAAARNHLRDCVLSYWRLWAAFRKYESASKAESAAEKLFKQLQELEQVGESADLVAAREAYANYREKAASLRKALLQQEADLRWRLGVSQSDGRLIRPSERFANPTLAEFRSHLTRSQSERARAIRDQQSRVSKAQSQLQAATNSLIPNLPTELAENLKGASEDAAKTLERIMLSSNGPIATRAELVAVRNAQLKLIREQKKLQELQVVDSKSERDAVARVAVTFESLQNAFNQLAVHAQEIQSLQAYRFTPQATKKHLSARSRLMASELEYADWVAQFVSAVAIAKGKNDTSQNWRIIVNSDSELGRGEPRGIESDETKNKATQ